PDGGPQRGGGASDEVGPVERHARTTAAQLERPGALDAGQRVVQFDALKHRAQFVIAVRPRPEHPQIEIDLRVTADFDPYGPYGPYRPYRPYRFHSPYRLHSDPPSGPARRSS